MVYINYVVTIKEKAHLLVNNQFCSGVIYVATPTNQKWDVIPNDLKVRWSERALGTIALSSSCLRWSGRSVLVSSYPPVSLLIGGFFLASRGVVTKRWLVVEYRTSLFPVICTILKVKFTRYYKRKLASVTEIYRKHWNNECAQNITSGSSFLLLLNWNWLLATRAIVYTYRERRIDTYSFENPGNRFLCFDMVIVDKGTIR